MENKLAIIDTDEVIVSLLSVLDPFVVQNYAPSLSSVPKHGHYDLLVRYPWLANNHILDTVLHAFADSGGYASIPFYDGSEEAIEKLRSADWRIEIVSGINPEWLHHRHANLSPLGIERDQIHLVGLRNSKLETIQNLKYRHGATKTIFVDDLASHLNAAGHLAECYMVDQRYLDQVSPDDHVVVHQTLLDIVNQVVNKE